MKISLSHVTDLGNEKDIHLYISTEDNSHYFEKLLGLDNGKYLVAHALKQKTDNGYSASFVEGSIYDKNGEVCIVPNRVFHEDDLIEIEEWLLANEKLWNQEL